MVTHESYHMFVPFGVGRHVLTADLVPESQWEKSSPLSRIEPPTFLIPISFPVLLYSHPGIPKNIASAAPDIQQPLYTLQHHQKRLSKN
jgi:hypothetical protein